MAMKTRYNRHGHRGHADLAKKNSPEEIQYNHPGDVEHHENEEGDRYDIYGENINRFEHWDDDPDRGIYRGEDHPWREMADWLAEPYARKRERGMSFRARNMRYRNHLRRYRRRRDFHFDIDRENLFRERGSIDEHLSGNKQGFKGNW